MVTQALPAILLAFMNTGWFGDDDEKKKEYDELSEYTKIITGYSKSVTLG